jgi:hypothetical protein
MIVSFCFPFLLIYILRFFCLFVCFSETSSHYVAQIGLEL